MTGRIISTQTQQDYHALQILIQLQRRARKALDKAELAFVMVNNTKQLISYRQAVLWQKDHGVVAVSGLPDFDKNSPYVQWMNRLGKELSGQSEIKLIIQSDISDDLAIDWESWLPPYCLILPMKKNSQNTNVTGCLILACDTVPEDLRLTEDLHLTEDFRLTEELADAYGHAWDALTRRSFSLSGFRELTRKKAVKLAFLLAITLIFAIPVRLSVLVPAEVAAKDPVIVRAPLNGVIDQFHVKPNETVTKDQALFDLEKTLLENRLNVVRTTLKVAQAEYRRAAQLALFDDKTKMDLAILLGRLKEKKAEFAYVEDLLRRINIVAPKEGVALFSDVSYWQGRAVELGEKVLTLADPSRVELILYLPVDDAIGLETGCEVTFFLNITPGQPLTGKLNYISYRAEAFKDKVISYRLKSTLNARHDIKGQVPRIGLTGTAKVYGEKVSLFYYIFRRPIGAIRRCMGI